MDDGSWARQLGTWAPRHLGGTRALSALPDLEDGPKRPGAKVPKCLRLKRPITESPLTGSVVSSEMKCPGLAKIDNLEQLC